MDQKGIGAGIIVGVILVIIAGVFGSYFLVVYPRTRSNGITPPSEFTQTNQYSQGGYTYTSYSGSGTTQYALSTFKTQMQSQGWTYTTGGVLGGYSGDRYEKGSLIAIVSAAQVSANQVEITVVTGTTPGGEGPESTPASTSSSLSPSTFAIQSGASTTLVSTLTSSGSPLSGKSLEFSASVGNINIGAGITDSNGHVSITYTAPTVNVQTSVTITASFAGDIAYTASSTSSSGTIEPNPIVDLTAEVTVPTYISSTLLHSLSQDILNSMSAPLATVNLSNRGDATAKNVSVKARISGYGDYYSVPVGDMAGGSSTTVKITPRASSEIMNLTSDTYGTAQVIVEYYDESGNLETIETSKEIRITEINSFSWWPPEWVSAWVTPTDVSVRAFATEATRELGATTNDSGALEAAERIFNEMGAYGINYITDAHTSGDYVQFPVQVLKNKSGDCEDLAILYSSLLESVGVSTRLILVPGHMFAAIILPSGTRKPIETTAVGGDFDYALSCGASEYQSYSQNGQITEINPTSQHWLGVGPADVAMSASIPNINVSISDPTYWWEFSAFSWRARVTVTFTNNGDASGARGIRICATNDSGNLVDIVGESTQYLEFTHTVNANSYWSKDVTFAPGGWFSADTIHVQPYTIIQ